jgi:hypothetical protein
VVWVGLCFLKQHILFTYRTILQELVTFRAVDVTSISPFMSKETVATHHLPEFPLVSFSRWHIYSFLDNRSLSVLE